MQRVLNLVGLQERKVEELLHGRHRQRLILLNGKRRQSVPGLRGDHDPRAARSDDVAERFEHERCPVQVDLEDRLRRRLRRGNPGRVDQPGDLSQPGGVLDEPMHGLARRRVDRRDGHVVAGITEGLGGGVGVLLAHVGEQDVLADADAPRDRLTDQARSDDDDDVGHGLIPLVVGSVYGGQW
jgi:hypothetical protein